MTKLNVEYLSRLSSIDANAILDAEQRELVEVCARRIDSDKVRTQRWAKKRQRRINQVREELFGKPPEFINGTRAQSEPYCRNRRASYLRVASRASGHLSS